MPRLPSAPRAHLCAHPRAQARPHVLRKGARRIAAVLAAAALGASHAAPPDTHTRRSGYDDMGPALQAMQRDDAQNPGLLWVHEGEGLWQQPPSHDRPACSGCHPADTMVGVAARYPAFDEALQRPVTLAQRINLCRQRHQAQAPWALESDPLLALESRIAHASRGLPVAPPHDARLAPFVARGAARWQQRLGQLNLSCAQCHDQRAGQHLGGSLIPQGRANGYPLYRLEWQALGSLSRRLRNCLTGVRAAPFPPDDMAWVELALYLAERDRGLPVEAPAVRP